MNYLFGSQYISIFWDFEVGLSKEPQVKVICEFYFKRPIGNCINFLTY